MKNYTVSILLSLGCCIAWAQSDLGVSATVSESTDPARAAEVERKAQEISNQDDRSSGSSGKEEQVRSGERNKKLRSHHKSKSSSGQDRVALVQVTDYDRLHKNHNLILPT